MSDLDVDLFQEDFMASNDAKHLPTRGKIII